MKTVLSQENPHANISLAKISVHIARRVAKHIKYTATVRNTSLFEVNVALEVLKIQFDARHLPVYSCETLR